jgi:E3 ubiquitin-protein ligase RBX1
MACESKDEEVVCFAVKKWSPVFMWGWDIQTDACAICRNSLCDPSIEFEANPSQNNKNGLSIAFGMCGHVYHLDCVQRWLNKQVICPLCQKQWEYERMESLAGHDDF